MPESSVLIGYIISNIVAVFLIIAAIKWPVTARVLISLIFLWAAYINANTAIYRPEVYLEYADYSPFAFMDAIITGPFSRNITLYVSMIAFGQLCIAVFTGFKGLPAKIALFGAVIFLLAITPLGFGSGFPFTLLMIIACIIVIRKDTAKSFWDILSKKNLKGRIT